MRIGLIVSLAAMVLLCLGMGLWMHRTLGLDDRRKTASAGKAVSTWLMICLLFVTLAGLSGSARSMLLADYGLLPLILMLGICGALLGVMQLMGTMTASVRTGGKGLPALSNHVLGGGGRAVLALSLVFVLLLGGRLVNEAALSMNVPAYAVQPSEVEEFITEDMDEDAQAAVLSEKQEEEEASANIQQMGGMLALLLLLLLAAFQGMRALKFPRWLACVLEVALAVGGYLILNYVRVSMTDTHWLYVIWAVLLLGAIVPMRKLSIPYAVVGAAAAALLVVLSAVGLLVRGPELGADLVSSRMTGVGNWLNLLLVMLPGSFLGIQALLATQGISGRMTEEKQVKPVAMVGMLCALCLGVLIVFATAGQTRGGISLYGLTQGLSYLGIPQAFAGAAWQFVRIALTLGALTAVAAIGRKLLLRDSREGKGTPASTRILYGIVLTIAAFLLTYLARPQEDGSFIAPLTGFTLAACAMWIPATWLRRTGRTSWPYMATALIVSLLAATLCIYKAYPIAEALIRHFGQLNTTWLRLYLSRTVLVLLQLFVLFYTVILALTTDKTPLPGLERE